MRNRELEAFLSLGKKKDGTYFTPEDIRSFNTSRQAEPPRESWRLNFLRKR